MHPKQMSTKEQILELNKLCTEAVNAVKRFAEFANAINPISTRGIPTQNISDYSLDLGSALKIKFANEILEKDV